MRTWVAEAVHRIEADYQRSADTHLIPDAKEMLDEVLAALKG